MLRRPILDGGVAALLGCPRARSAWAQGTPVKRVVSLITFAPDNPKESVIDRCYDEALQRRGWHFANCRWLDSVQAYRR